MPFADYSACFSRNNRDFAIYLFCPGIKALNKCCVYNPDSEAYRNPSLQLYFLSGLRSYVEHRCIALLYLIPMGNFNCAIMSGSLGVGNELAEGLPFWNIPIFRESLSRFIGRAGGKTGSSNYASL